MKKNGVVSSKDIERFGNIVTKSLSGTIFEEEIKISPLKLEYNDCVFLCSDGLYRVVDPQLLISLSNIELDKKMKAYDVSVEDNYTLIRLIM
jgi:serine/threonine protein phosphatase PrpC